MKCVMFGKVKCESLRIGKQLLGIKLGSWQTNRHLSYDMYIWDGSLNLK